ncbi:MAG TPA: hypothetical protein DDW49_06730 [Deltaproteobacteria bacterium]|nr:MAG: hypothetical protein A2048_02970 [Deltaproteobacteria bacterium GWA2_45_12]HBF13065.1 hypothetical protein [Deltaproteobacteria bacterium]
MLNPLRLIFALDRGLARIEGWLLILILIVMLVMTSMQVILRNFFDTAIGWGDVFARHLVLWIGFFGATLSTKDDRHIKIDALLNVIPKKFHPIIQIFVTIFCILVCTLLANAAYRFMHDEKMANTFLFGHVPNWYFLIIMPLGFYLIAFRYVVRLLEIFLKFGGKKVEDLKPIHTPEIDISLKIKL